MSSTEEISDNGGDILFGSRTILVPGRKVLISYSVRKKSSFPLVEEIALKLLYVVGCASLEDLAEFMALPAKDIATALQPLTEKDLITQSDGVYILSDFGMTLFSHSVDGTPSITESESRQHLFTVDDLCALPSEAKDLGVHLSQGKGNFRHIISDLPPHEDFEEPIIGKISRNFGQYFAHFMRNKGDLEKIRDEQLELHKTDHVKTKVSLAIRGDIQCLMRKNGQVTNRVTPFDNLSVRDEKRIQFRNALIQAATTPAQQAKCNELEFLRLNFGEDFIFGDDILEVVDKVGVLQWFNVIPRFYSTNSPKMKSGAIRAIGELCMPKNLSLFENTLEAVTSMYEFSAESPLRIAWLRPGVNSWGRSIAFLEGISRIRELCKGMSKSVIFEMWENRSYSDTGYSPQPRSYTSWFDEVRIFRSSAIPEQIEAIFIGDRDGLMVTHSFTPPKSCFPCPIGVAFTDSENIHGLLSKQIAPSLRALPQVAKKRINRRK